MKKQETVIITGGTSGLGFKCAQTLASQAGQWRVVITGRDHNKAEAAARRINEQVGEQKVVGCTLDLRSFASVRRFVGEIAAESKTLPLQAIVCNAAIQIVKGTQYTEDGFEATFGVNHLGHFLLVDLLLPHISLPGRIVVVSSGTHDPARRTGMPAPRYQTPATLAWPVRHPGAGQADGNDAFIGRQRYTTSKLCNLLYTFELSKRLQASGRPITVNGFDPGLMPGTGLARDYSAIERIAWNFLFPALRLFVPNVNSTTKSGAALARLITDPAMQEVSGRYFEGRHEVEPSEESRDNLKQQELWEASMEIIGERVFLNKETKSPIGFRVKADA